MQVANLEGPVKRPLSFLPGCNTPHETTLDHVRLNVERDLPWLEKQPDNGKTLAIVAGGPSLRSYWPQILKCDSVLSLNNSYSFLMDRGIVPDYWMLLDARKDNESFLTNPSPSTVHYVAAQCHPVIFDRLADHKVTLYLTVLEGSLEACRHINKPKHQIAGNVGTVGFKALCLAYALGYRKLRLFGYDSCYAVDHHAYPQPLNDGANKIEVFLGERKYITTGTLAHQATGFPDFARELVEHFGCEIELCCAGLLPDMVAKANEDGMVPLAQREREKYEAMWERDRYRDFAPGEHFVKQAVADLGMKPGESVIDFGCGTGRGAAEFQALGFRVTGVDFATNCFDPGVSVPFVEACLWDMPPMYADWGYCTDVMEHIPREKVLDVLAGIRERCGGAFFNIATTDDSMGAIIGKKLHMTVMDAGAWAPLLKKYWPDVKSRTYEGGVVFVCTTTQGDNGGR